MQRIDGHDLMPTRNVVLTEHQANLVESLVSSGRYQNASEVLRDGLRLVEQKEQFVEAKIAALRTALDEAEAAVAAGDVHEFGPGFLDGIEDERASEME